MSGHKDYLDHVMNPIAIWNVCSFYRSDKKAVQKAGLFSNTVRGPKNINRRMRRALPSLVVTAL
jgi:hypothetical protein